jgi:hypothetical protein
MLDPVASHRQFVETSFELSSPVLLHVPLLSSHPTSIAPMRRAVPDTPSSSRLFDSLPFPPLVKSTSTGNRFSVTLQPRSTYSRKTRFNLRLDLLLRPAEGRKHLSKGFNALFLALSLACSLSSPLDESTRRRIFRRDGKIVVQEGSEERGR